MSALWNHVAQQIEHTTGKPFKLKSQQSAGGGCINSASKVTDGKTEYFVKTNRAALIDMFDAELEGLREMYDSHTIRVPEPFCTGTYGDHAYIVMESLSFGGNSTNGAQLLGEHLAAMHQVTRPKYGWHRDNTIGSTLQVNTRENDWITFYREHRLRFQLELAHRKGCGNRLYEQGLQLLDELPVFFTGYKPVASLLHGDLWGGNFSILTDGTPAIFDPATYYGDRETDIAMTELFGGFGGAFYDAYNHALPLDTGYKTRKTLYNLYHIINHFNLFGGGYASQAEGMVNQLLSAIR